jgi:hypothetical protein
LTVSLFATVFFGLGLAGTGLGMQAEYRRSAVLALVISSAGAAFWALNAVFWWTAVRWAIPALLATAFFLGLSTLLAFALGATKEMRRHPPPTGHDLIPPGYKIPYSHYHDDPPEARLAAELEQRRQRLAVQQKELEMLEEKLRRKLERDEPEKP